jgi:serine/threonine protein kinase
VPDVAAPEAEVEAILRVFREPMVSGVERRLGIAGILRAIGAPEPEAVALGRYRVESKIGEGAMGVVYRAYDPELERTVAIKVLRSRSEDERERIRDEARALARLTSPHVVAVYDLETAGDDVFLTMEHIAGQHLRGWLEAHPQATWREIVSVFVQAA